MREECPISLNSVSNSGICGCMFLLQLNNLLKKFLSGQCWFTPMPGKENIRSGGHSYVLPDIFFQHFVRHSKISLFLVDPLFIKIIAIGACQVTCCPNRFYKYLKIVHLIPYD